MVSPKSDGQRPVKFWRTPLDLERQRKVTGHVHIVKDRCKGCEFCVEYCPRDVLSMSDEFNVKGYHPPLLKEEGICVDCGLCEMICPEFAIFCVPEGQRLSEVEAERGGAT